jgi:hypothetical protein
MEDLSRYAAPEGTIPFEGHEKLRLNDLQVCQLIGPYILAAINSLELISSVRKLVITPEHVRAYFPVPFDPDVLLPEFIEIKLPKGVYERSVDL